MSTKQELVDALRAKGERMTVARRAIVGIFVDARSPLTAHAVLTELRKKRMSTAAPTVYRELTYLTAQGVIRPMQFEERSRRYELMPTDHRHHLICRKCDRIEDVVLDHDLDQVEQSLGKNKGFKVEKHALEFYGLCESCQQ